MVISIGFISWFVFHLERLHEKIIEKMRGHSHGKFRLIFSYCIVMEGGARLSSIDVKYSDQTNEICMISFIRKAIKNE